MDLFEAMKERRSCRNFLPDPVEDETIDRVLEAASWAPSPLNMQPWHFTVVKAPAVKEAIHREAERCRAWVLDKSGWKWLGTYDTGFLKKAPVVIAVLGDPKKTGVDMFMDRGGTGYQHACAAAIQNMLLAAHGLGLGSVWFTFFDKGEIRRILKIGEDTTPLALVCLGRPASTPPAMPRKDFRERTTVME